MVLQDHVRYRPREVDAPDNLGAGLSVLFEQSEFGGLEAARLAQDLRRHRELADVVDLGRDSNAGDVILLQPNLGGDGHR